MLSFSYSLCFVTMLSLFDLQHCVVFLVHASALLMSIAFHYMGFGSFVCFIRFSSSHFFLFLVCFDAFVAVLLVFFVFVFRCLVLLQFFRISVLRCFCFISFCVVASALRVLPAGNRLTVYRRPEVKEKKSQSLYMTRRADYLFVE